ncbi:hypothetical protein [Phaeobacter phage MD18]|nr:hypothetical protein [Phaeobacter phage MD18]
MRIDMNKPPFTPMQRQFWACPVHVITAMIFSLIGFLAGILVCLMLLGARPAGAQDLTRHSCAERAATASLVMGFRQRGWDRGTVLAQSTSDPTQRMVLNTLVDAAWEQPRYEVEWARRLAQDAFMRGVFNGCIDEQGGA